MACSSSCFVAPFEVVNWKFYRWSILPESLVETELVVDSDGICITPVFSSRTVTSFHWLGVNHCYGVVCHPTPHILILAFPLV